MKLVIADDSLLVREGLVRLLSEAGCEITGTAADANGLVREVYLTRPEAVIVDIKMPPSFTDEGIRAARGLIPLSAFSSFPSTWKPNGRCA
jgi:DNA-binding NarL/FixJ family response regulator